MLGLSSVPFRRFQGQRQLRGTGFPLPQIFVMPARPCYEVTEGETKWNGRHGRTLGGSQDVMIPTALILGKTKRRRDVRDGGDVAWCEAGAVSGAATAALHMCISCCTSS